MKNLWLALAFIATLAVGLLAGIILTVVDRSGEQGSATPPLTVTVEKTVPTQTSSSTTTTTAPAQTLESLTEARDAFEQAVRSYGNPNLQVTEVMEFANNYYAEVREEDTGIGAMELLIDKPSGQVYPEPGPNMMWNTKYGMMSGGRAMGGMMGPGRGGMMGPNSLGRTQPGGLAGEMTVSPEQAREIADRYLDRVSPGTQAGEAERFYGYYTLHTEKGGEITGMLSVNGYSGEVWYHSWHGPFIAMEAEEE
jgi:hypothetical protein